MRDTAWNEAIQAAIEACTNVIKSYDVMKPDGKTYESLKIQKAAKGMVSLAREDIAALLDAEAPAQKETDMSIKELKAALGQLLDQVYQMQGMFDDEDGAIANAVFDAEKALNIPDHETKEDVPTQ